MIELDPVAGPGATQDRRHDGYQCQSAYLVQRAHVLIAGIKQPLPSRPGGTAEAVTWRRDRSLMPAAMPRYRPRPNPAAPDTPGLVLIDVGQQKVREEPFGVRFALHAGDAVVSVALQVPGPHNVSNALAAIGAAMAAGVPMRDAAEAIGGFVGLRRRMELVGEAGGVAVIDDFGHNPDKIAATLDALHAFPGRLLLLFQPHGYGPLKVMGRELVATFADRMRESDVLVLPDPVYQGGTVAREVGSDDIARGVEAAGRDARHIADRAAAAATLVDLARAGDRIVVMGARDDTLSLLAQGMVRDLRAR